MMSFGLHPGALCSARHPGGEIETATILNEYTLYAFELRFEDGVQVKGDSSALEMCTAVPSILIPFEDIIDVDLSGYTSEQIEEYGQKWWYVHHYDQNGCSYHNWRELYPCDGMGMIWNYGSAPNGMRTEDEDRRVDVVAENAEKRRSQVAEPATWLDAFEGSSLQELEDMPF